MLKIVTSPDPLLREVSQPCEPGDPSLIKLSKQMAKAMYKNDGVGLAAPQVGVLKRIIVIDCDVDTDEKNPIVLVNPEIVELSGEPEEGFEGCLSCPGISVPIERQPYAKVSYYDLQGTQCEIEGDGLLGRCLQHEIDHLNGRTLFESIAPKYKIEALQAYEEASKRGARPGETHTIIGA